MANFTVILAIISISLDGFSLICFRQNSTEIKYFDYKKFPKFLSLISLSMEGTALLPGIYASTQNK